ncbi:MAG: LuxR C-terminal-related transcriptional regulator [Acidimicrobiales bacterium]
MPSSLEDLIESAVVPLGVVELPSSKVLVGNEAMARVLGHGPGTFVGTRTLDMLVPEQRQAADEALQALADGELTGYQAVRSFRAPDGPTHELALWVCAVDVEGGRLGLISAVPLDGRGAQIDPVTAVLSAPTPGHVALGTLDLQWRVDRVSHDVVELLGYQLEEVVGLPVLGGLHPGDLPVFLAAVERARADQRAVVVSLRLGAKSGAWVPVRAVLATLSKDYPPALAFALTTGGEGALTAVTGDDRPRLDSEVQRITRDLRVAGVVPRLERLPDVARFPQLSRLSAREWQILVLLLEGERVASIAADLYVSPSTVRSQLSSIFSKIGVHSQADLIHRLRSD